MSLSVSNFLNRHVEATNIKIYAALLRYIGNSEKNTGNWCFKDGTISFQDIFHLFRRTCHGKVLSIISDCSYSGQWVRECTKTLDSLQIAPCGHRARENGAMVKVCTSCQPDQEAAEPCYSIEAVEVMEDGSIVAYSKKLTQQKSMWFDSTKLVCCRAPDSPCPQTTFQCLTWMNMVKKSITLHLIQKREGDRDMWYYLLLHRPGDDYNQQFQSQFRRDPNSLQLSDWGYVLKSGVGENPPQQVKVKVGRWITVFA